MTDTESLIDLYVDMLYRICLVELQNEADAEDAVQETFIRFIKKRPRTDSDEHTKAWLIRTAVNYSRDIKRRNRIRATEDIELFCERIADTSSGESDGAVIRVLMSLPEKFSRVMMLHFVEELDYKTIAGIIGRTESAVKMRIKKGRELFISQYKKEMGIK